MWFAWNATYVIAFSGSIFGTYALARYWGISQLSSFFTAVIFGFSSFFSLHIIHHSMLQVASLLPLLVLSSQLILSKHWKIGFYLTIFVISQQIFAGHPPYLFISFIGASFLYLGRVWFKNRRSLIKLTSRYFLAVAFALGLGAVQLLPTWEYIQNSSLKDKLNWEYVMHFDFPWQHFFTLINPNFLGNPDNGTYFLREFLTNSIYWENTIFIGWLPLGLALFALLKWKHNFQIVSLSILAIVSALLIPGQHSPANIVFHLPIFQLFRIPSRYQLLLIFSLTFLAGFGFDYLKKQYNLSKNMLALAIVFGIWQIYSFSWQQNPLVPVEALTKAPEVLALIPSNSRLITDYSSEEAWRNTYITQGWSQGLEPYLWFRNSLASSSNLLFNQKQLRVYAGIGSSRSDLLYENADFVQLTQLADYTISTSQTPSLAYATTAGIVNNDNRQLPSYIVHQHKNSVPPYFLTSQFDRAESLTSAIKAIRTSTNFVSQPIIETDKDYNTSSSSANLVQLNKSSKTSSSFTIETDTPQWFIWQQTYYPGWQAKLDQESVEISPANVSFQAVYVPPGNHTLEMSFQPKSIKIGFGVTLAALFSLIISSQFLSRLDQKH